MNQGRMANGLHSAPFVLRAGYQTSDLSLIAKAFRFSTMDDRQQSLSIVHRLSSNILGSNILILPTSQVIRRLLGLINDIRGHILRRRRDIAGRRAHVGRSVSSNLARLADYVG